MTLIRASSGHEKAHIHEVTGHTRGSVLYQRLYGKGVQTQISKLAPSALDDEYEKLQPLIRVVAEIDHKGATDNLTVWT